MGTDVIVLNGVSSSGKSSIALCLQVVLPQPWLTLGIDDLIKAMPRHMEAEIARVRKDEDFTARAGRLLKRDKALLDRLSR